MTPSEKKIYPSDLTTKQCDLFQSILHTAEPKKAGASLKWPLKKNINAIMYVTKSGCQWRMLSSEFPPWQTVYYHFNKWCKNGHHPHRTWKTMAECLCREFQLKNQGRIFEHGGVLYAC
jgi:transposase